MAVKKKSSKKKRPTRKTSRLAQRAAQRRKPSSTLRIALTLPGPDGLGLTKAGSRMTSSVVADFRPSAATVEAALVDLQRRGFKVTTRGKMSVSLRGSRSLFEKTFGTKLSTFKATATAHGQPATGAFYFPGKNAPWKPSSVVSSLIDDAYIQWPHVYMDEAFPSSGPSPLPPRVDYHHLRVPGDVTLLLGADRVHRRGTTGRGVRVAMVDSGFAHGHPYFVQREYNTTTVLAPGATDPDQDGNGHGTGESANLLAIAPDVTFVGVKLDNENNPSAGASLLEGFQEAISHNPDVVSVSLGFDLCPTSPVTGRRTSNIHLTTLPNSLLALEAEIQAAVAAGVVVVFSAGNGHVAFPGMMPGVISAGGTFVDEDGSFIASDYASGFVSKPFPGRVVPDFTGLVGLAANNADYIMLPIPPGCDIDRGNAAHDGTRTDDGWGVFSGTSAAAPQLAGICALLLEKDPSLSPADVKSALRLSARDVARGTANPASNENQGGAPAVSGPDSATGAGLVDAFAAWMLV